MVHSLLIGGDQFPYLLPDFPWSPEAVSPAHTHRSAVKTQDTSCFSQWHVEGAVSLWPSHPLT